MPHLEHHPLARRQLAQHVLDAGLQLIAQQRSLRIGMRAFFGNGIHPVQRPVRRGQHGRFLAPDLSLAEMIQAQVGYDPVQPGMKAAVEPERVQVPVDAQERFLVDVARVLG